RSCSGLGTRASPFRDAARARGRASASCQDRRVRQSHRQEVTVTTRQPTALRQRMLDDMRLRNMAAGTCRSYVRSVADFSAFHGRSPDELTLEDVRDYQLHLVARGLKASTICPIMSALRFLYGVTLDRPEQAARIPLPRKADPLPAILSQDEVA